VNHRRRFKISLAVLAIAGVAHAPPVQAQARYLSVQWTGALQEISFSIFGNSITGSRIGPVSGYLDGVLDNRNTIPGQTLPRLFCCDVFQEAPGGTPDENFEWDVTRYTEADGVTGWLTPHTGTDRWRDMGSVRRAGFLVNKWGRGTWLSTGSATERAEKTIALNVAVWKASYGARFDLTGTDGGMTAAQKGYYDTYMVDYDAGREATRYAWYDNSADDLTDERQDFLEPVPEPGTLLLLASGIIGSGLALIRRRS